MTPKVSVVIKAYNHAAFIRQAIQSILEQSFQDFEIIVTDDGSTDGTPDVVRTFPDPRIDLHVFEHNRGISNAMNATIARARGEFIAILNSDDFALPGRLERQVAFLDTHPEIAAVFGMPLTVDESGAPTENYFDFRSALRFLDYSRKTWLKFFFFSGNVLCAPTAMIRRSVYTKLGSYDPRLTNLQDLDMWVRLSADHAIHVVSEELTAFRIRKDHQNASAPRPDTLLRSQFEYAQILKRYRTMNPAILRETFAEYLAEREIAIDASPDLWLAELALTIPSPAHRLFAVETLFETARLDVDTHRFRNVAGTTDVFGIAAANERDARISELNGIVSRYERQLSDKVAELDENDTRISKLNGIISRFEMKLADKVNEIDGRDARISELTGIVSRYEKQLSDKAAELDENDARISELNGIISRFEMKLADKVNEIDGRDARISELTGIVSRYEKQLSDKAAELDQNDARISELNGIISAYEMDLADKVNEIDGRDARISELTGNVLRYEKQLYDALREAQVLGDSLQLLLDSRSWRYTSPLRRLVNLMRT
jgi:glycosyltransferase involved in cell wall biosynthesis